MDWQRQQQEASLSQLILWLLKGKEQKRNQHEPSNPPHTHTQADTQRHSQQPSGEFHSCLFFFACQDLHHQVPETPKASEKPQRDERITDKTENILNHTQTLREKKKGEWWIEHRRRDYYMRTFVLLHLPKLKEKTFSLATLGVFSCTCSQSVRVITNRNAPW